MFGTSLSGKGIYFVTSLSLVLIPLLKGNSADFCMRVCIPALFVLIILVQDTLEAASRKKDLWVLGGLLIVLFIGSITPIHEIARTIKGTVEYQNNGMEFKSTVSEEVIFGEPNFSGSVNDNFFFEHIAKTYSRDS